MRRIAIVPILTVTLATCVLTLSLWNEYYWALTRERVCDEGGIRELIGLPSIAAGTSYAGTRNPLLEVLCTPLYDLPRGYCYSVAASFIGNPLTDPEVYTSTPGFNNTWGTPDSAEKA